MTDARDEGLLASTRRAARLCLALALLLLAVAGVAGLLAQARAERLLRVGTPSEAVVVEHVRRGKSSLAVLQQRDGRRHVVRVGDGRSAYPPGRRVRLIGTDADVRTDEEWNTPTHLYAPAVLGTGGGLGLLVVAGALAQHARGTRRRVAAGRWLVVQTAGRTVPARDATVELPREVWPVPATVEVLDEPPRRDVLVRLRDGVGTRHVRLRRSRAGSSASR